MNTNCKIMSFKQIEWSDISDSPLIVITCETEEQETLINYIEQQVEKNKSPKHHILQNNESNELNWKNRGISYLESYNTEVALSLLSVYLFTVALQTTTSSAPTHNATLDDIYEDGKNQRANFYSLLISILLTIILLTRTQTENKQITKSAKCHTIYNTVSQSPTQENSLNSSRSTILVEPEKLNSECLDALHLISIHANSGLTEQVIVVTHSVSELIQTQPAWIRLIPKSTQVKYLKDRHLLIQESQYLSDITKKIHQASTYELSLDSPCPKTSKQIIFRDDLKEKLLNSTATIMLLYGPTGTGKTTIIQEFSKKNIYMVRESTHKASASYLNWKELFKYYAFAAFSQLMIIVPVILYFSRVTAEIKTTEQSNHNQKLINDTNNEMKKYISIMWTIYFLTMELGWYQYLNYLPLKVNLPFLLPKDLKKVIEKPLLPPQTDPKKKLELNSHLISRLVKIENFDDFTLEELDALLLQIKCFNRNSKTHVRVMASTNNMSVSNNLLEKSRYAKSFSIDRIQVDEIIPFKQLSGMKESDLIAEIREWCRSLKLNVSENVILNGLVKYISKQELPHTAIHAIYLNRQLLNVLKRAKKAEKVSQLTEKEQIDLLKNSLLEECAVNLELCRGLSKVYAANLIRDNLNNGDIKFLENQIADV